MRSRTNMIRENQLAESGENPEPTSAMLEGVLLISVALVLLTLPALLRAFDGLIRHTTLGMKQSTVGKEVV